MDVVVEIEAGKEADILVATEVMSWTRGGAEDMTSPAHKTRVVIEDGGRRTEAYLDHEMKGPHDRLTDPHGNTIYLCGCREADISVPNFTTDIADAWKVVKELEDIRDFEWSLVSRGSSGYAFRLWNDTWYDGFVGTGETEALAICRAALKYAAA